MITRRPKNLPITNSIDGDEYIEVWKGRPMKTLASLLMSSSPGGYDGNPAIIDQDEAHRFVTDTEKSTWNGKQDALGFTPANASHNHDSAYAALSHNHNSVYSALGHTHDYAASNHNHDLLYADIDHNHDGIYAVANHNHNGVYSVVGHNHDGAYAASGHNHSGTYEPANANIQAHVGSAHAPTDAQKNSDITKTEIEARLTGEITSHTHAGGAVDVKQTEVDFGTVPVKMKRFTITDAGVSPSNQILASLSYDDPSDGDADSAEWFENLVVMAKAGTGQFFLYCSSLYNDLNGKVKINFIIG